METARKHPDPSAASGRPILITGGDPAGVAPELVLALLPDLAAAARQGHNFVYFATAGGQHIAQFLERARSEELSVQSGPATDAPTTGVRLVDVRTQLDGDAARNFEARPGQPDEIGGRLAFAALRLACDLATTDGAHNAAQYCHGILTAPLSKEWVARGGQSDFQGHTEYLAERFACDVVMLMHGPRFSVLPLTVHIALADVPRALRERLAQPGVSRLLADLAGRPRFQNVRFALCGLNPHCGDGGLFGTEEQEFLNDWCFQQRAAGIPLDGPLPADTLFTDGVRERYRLMLSCYHDQGLVPFKALEGDAGINATIGLPVLRTSPDHGTAFDIAGQGQARVGSLQAALRTLVSGELAPRQA